MLFLFRLAQHLHKTVTELCDSIAAWEVPYWAALWSLDHGWGELRADVRAALVTSACLAPWTDGKKLSVQDCLPFPPELSPDDERERRNAQLRGLMAALKATALKEQSKPASPR